MSKSPMLMVVLDGGGGGERRMEAFEFYRKAFGAKKISGDPHPDEVETHIMMEINGYQFGIFPGDGHSRGNVTCQFEFDSEEELRKAYGVLSQGAAKHEIGTDFWCELYAMVTDRFGVFWCLCVPN